MMSDHGAIAICPKGLFLKKDDNQGCWRKALETHERTYCHLNEFSSTSRQGKDIHQITKLYPQA
jgi:hypothetical protein